MSEVRLAQGLFRRGLGRRCARADHRCHRLGGIQQRLWRQVGVALRHADLGMPEQPLDPRRATHPRFPGQVGSTGGHSVTGSSGSALTSEGWVAISLPMRMIARLRCANLDRADQPRAFSRGGLR